MIKPVQFPVMEPAVVRRADSWPALRGTIPCQVAKEAISSSSSKLSESAKHSAKISPPAELGCVLPDLPEFLEVEGRRLAVP